MLLICRRSEKKKEGAAGWQPLGCVALNYIAQGFFPRQVTKFILSPVASVTGGLV